MQQLFHQTRLRLAAWYAGVMGCILAACGLGLYHVVAHAYQETIDQGLESVARALGNSIAPVLQHPGELRQLAQQLSLSLCQTQTDCFAQTAIDRSPLPNAIRSVRYYMRLLDSTERPIALTQFSPQLAQVPVSTAHWQTLINHSGLRYRQVSLPLDGPSQRWGYLQVGRSLDDMEQHLVALRLTLLLGCPVALLVIAWSSWWLAGLAMQPIYRSYQQMQQFTADAAHELRTPLAAMQSTIESGLLQQQGLGKIASREGENSTILTILKRQNLRLSQLVKDLLLLARMDQEVVVSSRSPCCLNDLIDDLVEELAPLAIAAQVQLVAQIQVQELIEVIGNEEQLYRLVCNLIDNAIQATPADGKVSIVLNRNENHAIVQVQDTGVGIALADRIRIFDRFYRVQQDRSRRTGGSGLGLAIAQAIVRLHHGSIHVQSQLGQGSCFTVQLPLK